MPRSLLGRSEPDATAAVEARRLLEATSWPVERVASACGFGSVVTLRQNFVAAYATTPTSYRQRFALPQP